jgi:hypothetical protein
MCADLSCGYTGMMVVKVPKIFKRVPLTDARRKCYLTCTMAQK